ncbi:MAG TPA: His/Gly/Thr/Pro-type tRNA ligase C-terminal domain-containing protein, partial [Verrucomicrobiae bacterium]|nr:His/Gly/Thr/Pro-type tRNA ligase C-terminal domain-containing protein [Verrucomicrobiae bacterium]
HEMYEIRLNSRQLTDYMLKDYLKLSEQEAHNVSKLVDRLSKMERGDFIAKIDAAISPTARETGVVEKLLAILDIKDLKELPQELQKHSSVSELSSLLNTLNKVGITNVLFDLALMRGFDYYTDIVFEVFDLHPDNNRSMLGGGRYDGLVGLFGVAPIPTVGFGWGDVTLANFLELHHLLPDLRSETDLYVILAGDVMDAAQQPIAELRAAGLKVAVDLSERKLGDQLKTADKKGIKHVLIIGEDELQSGKMKVRDLDTGQEASLPIDDLIKNMKD